MQYIVQNLNNMENNQDHFNILRKIQKKPNSTQRELAEELNFSLGKLNYCLQELQSKGLLKIKNFLVYLFQYHDQIILFLSFLIFFKSALKITM